MRVTFICVGVPQTNSGSVRAFRALEWLSAKHDVQLVTIQTDDIQEQPNEGLGRKLNIEIGPTLRQPGPSWLAGRLWPGLGVRRSEELSVKLTKAARGSDWVWLAWWQGAASIDWNQVQNHGGKVTWDFDAMSLWHWTAARAALRANPIRAAQRFISGMSFRRFEDKYLNELDAVSVPSVRDQRWLADRLSPPVVQIRAFPDIGAMSEVRRVKPSSSGPTVVFVGSLYEPNIKGLRWFLRHVWPGVIEQIPESSFLIVGRGIDPKLFRHLPPRVRIVGSVPDIRPYLRKARVMVCPVFFGGGIPYKALDSAAGGRPTVVSPYVAETLGSSAGFAVADSAPQWIAALVNYLSNPDSADADGFSAYRNVQTNFSSSRWHDDMLTLESVILR